MPPSNHNRPTGNTDSGMSYEAQFAVIRTRLNQQDELMAEVKADVKMAIAWIKGVMMVMSTMGTVFIVFAWLVANGFIKIGH